MTEEQDDVQLQFTAAVAVDAHRVMRFVQELAGVPADAWCDVHNVWATTTREGERPPSQPQSQSQPRLTSTAVQISCDRRVADFLCQRFAKQTRHVSQGELLLVRCRRVFLRSLPTPSSTARATRKSAGPSSHTDDAVAWAEKAEEKHRRPAALSRAAMVDLLDCLGDRIVDVLEAFQAFSQPGEGGVAQLTMIGLVHALSTLSKRDWVVATEPSAISCPAQAKPLGGHDKRRSKEEKQRPVDRLAIQKVRHLVSQLIAGEAVALTAIPDQNDLPFMVYTDFIAYFVAYMSHLPHTPDATARNKQLKALHSGASEIRSRQSTIGASEQAAAVMRDVLGSTMDSTFSSSHPTTQPARRKSRKHATPSDLGPDPAAAFSDMFLGVSELASRDDGVTSQRSEGDDRRAGPSTSSGSRQRSRGSRSSCAGSSKKKTTSSVPLEDASRVVPGEDLLQSEASMRARQQLTSSASRVRPVKQPPQPQQQPPAKPSRSLRSTTRLGNAVTDEPTPHNDHNNNNNHCEETDEPIVEHAGKGGRASSHFVRGHAEWETMHGITQAGRLPTRSRRYLNYSAGSDGTLDPASTDEHARDLDEDVSPVYGLDADRPPSRQCHAFPTHLLDPREFFSPTKHHDGAAGINITPWHAEGDDREEGEAVSPSAGSPEDDVGSSHTAPQSTGLSNNQRPPSRYMVKPARGGTSSSSASSSPGKDAPGRLPSRRGAAGSRTQTTAQHYHDPKTDGFLDVDESVPPPFRVEISTEASRAQYVPSQHRRVDEERRHGLKSRRSSSFGSRSQLKTFQQQGLSGALERDGPTVREAESSAADSVVEPQWFHDLEPVSSKRVPDATSGVRHVAAVRRSSRSIVQPTASSSIGDTDDNNAVACGLTAHQWFRSINNPFFVSPAAPMGGGPVSGLYDDMDAEAALANTPLFAGEEDLVAMTQLTDLHLDDFMGDPCVYHSTSSGLGTLSTTTTKSSASEVTTAAASAALNTSLGRDFLSLFAQH